MILMWEHFVTYVGAFVLLENASKKASQQHFSLFAKQPPNAMKLLPFNGTIVEMNYMLPKFFHIMIVVCTNVNVFHGLHASCGSILVSLRKHLDRILHKTTKFDKMLPNLSILIQSCLQHDCRRQNLSRRLQNVAYLQR